VGPVVGRTAHLKVLPELLVPEQMLPVLTAQDKGSPWFVKQCYIPKRPTW